MTSSKKLRIPIVVGNWKMQGSSALVNSFLTELIKSSDSFKVIEVVVCPPALYLTQAIKLIQSSQLSNSNPIHFSNLWIGAQNAYFKQEGAYTGEISPSMLNDIGVKYVILGHSERRQYFGETDSLIARKCQAAYDMGLNPILCLGETAEEREKGLTFDVIELQLDTVLSEISKEARDSLLLAYEPVWAIGTGVTASPKEAEEVHAFLRKKLAKLDPKLSDKLRILYGGSVKANNAKDIFDEPNIDGVLVGGASLVAQEFLNICEAILKVSWKLSY